MGATDRIERGVDAGASLAPGSEAAPRRGEIIGAVVDRRRPNRSTAASSRPNKSDRLEAEMTRKVERRGAGRTGGADDEDRRAGR